MVHTLKIGSLTLRNNLLLAPMAGITDLPFRLLAREQGAALCFTEMVSVNGLVRDGQRSFELLCSSPGDRPLGIQLFGDDPELLAEATRRVEGYGDLLDLNLGCPVRKVVASGAGSALLREPAKVAAIIRAVRSATRLPLTVKIRSGWSCGAPNFLEIGRIAEAEGCDAVTLHPRSRAQMFGGKADWGQIAELQQTLAIPVIGSGDLFSARDAVAMLNQTGCAGAMVARGGLGNPWLFREALALLEGRETAPPTPAERLTVALRHLELIIATAGESVALREMRKHLSWYSHGLPGAAAFRDAVNRLTGKDVLVDAVRRFFEGSTHGC